MAVTVYEQPDESSAVEPADLDGHTLTELADYLDAGRTPIDESIEASPSCRHALAALTRLREVTQQVLQDPQPPLPDDEHWIATIMARIAADARSGRDITLEHGRIRPRILITEGAVKALIRSAGDTVASLLVGRVDIEGDLDAVEAPLTITIGVTVLYGADIPAATSTFRQAITTALQLHTARHTATLNVIVQDLQPPTSTEPDD